MEEAFHEELSLIKGRTTTAERIPEWLWTILARVLGIAENQKETNILSSLLYFLTFSSATITFALNALFCAYDIMSEHTKSDILDAAVSVMLTSFYCGLGVYSQRLAYRLLIHPKILDMLRLHSKRVIKLNSAFLVFVLFSSFVTLFNISSINNTFKFNKNFSFPDLVTNNTKKLTNINPCQIVGLQVQICQTFWISQVVYSVFFLVWNLLVAVVLVSVARTLTINIRKFLKEIEKDSSLLDKRIREYQAVEGSINVQQKYFWFEENKIVDVLEEVEEDKDSLEGSVDEAQESGGHIMTNQEIVSKYWTISMSVRLVSVKLQRWMSTIIGLVCAWTAIRLGHWISHTPTWYGVLMLIMPLVLIPLLTSSYAEVNYEGAKAVQSIFPIEGRIGMFRYLYGQPIQMTVYSHAITYGTIGTVVAGILAAFTSKILLQEIGAV